MLFRVACSNGVFCAIIPVKKGGIENASGEYQGVSPEKGHDAGGARFEASRRSANGFQMGKGSFP